MSGLRFSLVVGASALVLCAGEMAPRAQTPSQAASPAELPAPSSDQLARGAYIVEDVAQCARCHTPANSAGERDRSRWLQGGPLDVEPTIAKQEWAMVAPRIAGRPPGTDAEFVRLMMTGISRTGKRPARPMPQFRMTQSDAEAVLAYLKSLTTHERIGGR